MTDTSLSTHVLDLTTGTPVQGMMISLFAAGSKRTPLASAHSDDDGRIRDWGCLLTLAPGDYSLRFMTESWFADHQLDSLYHLVEIHFRIAPEGGHYHIPLLLSPFGYSTYRGS